MCKTCDPFTHTDNANQLGNVHGDLTLIFLFALRAGNATFLEILAILIGVYESFVYRPSLTLNKP